MSNHNGSTLISQHRYTLDAVGNRTQVVETVAQVGGGTSPSSSAYGYDHLDRLTSVDSGATTYTYDPVGNRLTKSSTTYTYDKADRILTAGSISYTVNANGNVTARGSDSFAYDQANRLTSASVSGTTSTYTYDGDGNRASKTVGGTTTSYVYDVNTSLPNVLTDGTLKYVYGLGLAYAVDGGGNVQVYHTDLRGSVRAITNGLGNVIARYSTDEFGIPTQTQGTSTQPSQFTGQQRDGESGLYYLWARMYDPTIGRFLSRDPFSGVLTKRLLATCVDTPVPSSPARLGVVLLWPPGISQTRVNP